jgi:hypothetical protein
MNLTISSLGKGSFNVYRGDKLVGVLYQKISGGFDTRVFDGGSIAGTSLGHAPDVRYGIDLIDLWLRLRRMEDGEGTGSL